MQEVIFVSKNISAFQMFTFRWDKSGTPRDRVPLYVVAALELFPVRRRDEGHSHAVATTVAVGPGPGQDQQVFRFLPVLQRSEKV